MGENAEHPTSNVQHPTSNFRKMRGGAASSLEVGRSMLGVGCSAFHQCWMFELSVFPATFRASHA
jgi:hypothetical protein